MIRAAPVPPGCACVKKGRQMLRQWISGAVVLGMAGAAAFWVLTAPKTLETTALDGITPDLTRGEWVFNAGGCAGCHADPEGDRTVLKGGMALASPFGTFYAPNISPDPANGIGGWSALDLANAMHYGTSPEGQHYYPAFPYPSYIRADLADIVSLHAYLQTLPADATLSRPHDIGFPFNIRGLLGGWKLLFLRDGPVFDPGDLTDEEDHGRYLVETLGHCGECHTPRNALGGPDLDRFLAGGPNPAGKGSIPNITTGMLDWSALDIASYLKTGFTPEYDSVGGHMAEVVENYSHLSDKDRAAVAAYLKRIPPHE